MAKIIVFNMVSVDGYFAGTDGDISWHNVDAEFNEFAIEQLQNEAGLLLFGRKTYELMSSYWPSEKSLKDDPIVAGLMNSIPKIVFSTSLDKAEWNNTKLVSKIDTDEITKLKQNTDKNIFIFGSGQIVQKFAPLGLIDEYRLMINPVVLGQGKTLFKDSIRLKLLSSREFKNGNILLSYATNKK
jgi:dihydrofolate reductase